jgi:hypothetical protein
MAGKGERKEKASYKMKCDQYGDSRTERQTVGGRLQAAGGRREAAGQGSRRRSAVSPRFPIFLSQAQPSPCPMQQE